MTEAELEMELNFAHATGRSAGVERLAAFIREAAGDAFTRGDDIEADLLRALADKADAMAAEEESAAADQRDELKEVGRR